MRPIELPRQGLPMTIETAIFALGRLKEVLGGDACLVVSVTDSGFEDVDVQSFVAINDGESRYVEVRTKPLSERT